MLFGTVLKLFEEQGRPKRIEGYAIVFTVLEEWYSHTCDLLPLSDADLSLHTHRDTHTLHLNKLL